MTPWLASQFLPIAAVTIIGTAIFLFAAYVSKDDNND